MLKTYRLTLERENGTWGQFYIQKGDIKDAMQWACDFLNLERGQNAHLVEVKQESTS